MIPVGRVMMQFHRNSPRDDRRRRVLKDETALAATGAPLGRGHSAGVAAEMNTDGSPMPSYSEAARRERQPHVTDLIPQRPWMIAAALVAALAVVAGFEMLYVWMPYWAAETTDGRIAALDLDGEGSLAAWFSSATLAVAAIIAFMVYTVRRHRLDDYHGRYRIWLWAGACWMLMSIDEGGSLHEGFKELMSHGTGTRLMGDGSLWWALPYLVVLGYVGLRLLLDMRGCRASMAALLGAAGCYAAGVVIQLGWVLPETGARGVMFEEGAEMVGHVMLVLAMTLHARFVLRDSCGLVQPRVKQPADGQPKHNAQPKVSAAAPPKEGAAARRRRTDLEPAEAHAKTVARKAEEAFEDEFDDPPARRAARKRHRIDESETDSGGKLTKAQRKAMRRQKERERREGLR